MNGLELKVQRKWISDDVDEKDIKSFEARRRWATFPSKPNAKRGRKLGSTSDRWRQWKKANAEYQAWQNGVLDRGGVIRYS